MDTSRIGVFLTVTALLFAGLLGRLVYLQTAKPVIIESAGLEIDVFYQPRGAAEAVTTDGFIRVPSVLDAGYGAAGEILLAAGLLAEARGDLDGRVIRQNPAPGTRVRRGTTVELWLER